MSSLLLYPFYLIFLLLFIRSIFILFFSPMHKFPECTDESSSDFVAVFYTVCNDFNAQSLLGLVNINYLNKHVFFLDDSKDDSLKCYIQNTFDTSAVTYIKRESRTGHKAGNINNALHELPHYYSYVFFADAEQVVEASCVNKGVLFLKNNPNLSFVQWLHKPIISNGELPQYLADAYGTMCEKEMRWRALLGTIPSLGHGILIRRSVLNDTNGLPEVVSEDFAWSLDLMAKGGKGILLTDDAFEEGFPNNFNSFSSRYQRWVRADYECACFQLLPIIKSGRLPVFTRIDVVVRQIKYIAAASILPFALLEVFIKKHNLLFLYTLEAIAIASIVMPIILAMRSKRIMAQFLDIYFISYSQIVPLFSGLIKSMIGFSAIFTVTGESKTNSKKKEKIFPLFIASIAIACCILYFSPILLFIAISSIGLAFHHIKGWNSFVSIAMRYMLVLFTLFWIYAAFVMHGVWQDDLCFLMTASAIIL